MFEAKEGTEVNTYVVEIKPKKQTKPPTNTKRRSYVTEMATYMINNSKWKSAETFCSEKGWNFKILTEEDLHIK